MSSGVLGRQEVTLRVVWTLPVVMAAWAASAADVTLVLETPLS